MRVVRLVVVFIITALFTVSVAGVVATYPSPCGDGGLCECDQCPVSSGTYVCPGGTNCLKIGCYCGQDVFGSQRCLWAGETWNSCSAGAGPTATPPTGPTSTPLPGTGGGGGSGTCGQCGGCFADGASCPAEYPNNAGQSSCSVGQHACCQVACPGGGGSTTGGLTLSVTSPVVCGTSAALSTSSTNAACYQASVGEGSDTVGTLCNNLGWSPLGTCTGNYSYANQRPVYDASGNPVYIYACSKWYDNVGGYGGSNTVRWMVAPIQPTNPNLIWPYPAQGGTIQTNYADLQWNQSSIGCGTSTTGGTYWLYRKDTTGTTPNVTGVTPLRFDNPLPANITDSWQRAAATTGSVTLVSTNPTSVTRTVAGRTTVITYTTGTWANSGTNTALWGNDYRYSSTSGAVVTFRFEGDRVTYIRPTGPQTNFPTQLDVTIDGVAKPSLNERTATTVNRAETTWAGLGFGAHTLVITKPTAQGTGTYLRVDAFRDDASGDFVYRYLPLTIGNTYSWQIRADNSPEASTQVLQSGTYYNSQIGYFSYPVPTATPTPSPTPSATPVPAFWQAEGGSVQTTGDIACILPQSTSKLVVTGTNNKEGTVISGTADMTLGAGGVSNAGWNLSSALDLSGGNFLSSTVIAKYDYNYFSNRVTAYTNPTAWPSNSVAPAAFLAFLDTAVPTAADGFKYTSVGSLTVEAAGNLNLGVRKVVILATGDVTFRGQVNVTPNLGLLIVLSSGNVVIDPGVGSTTYGTSPHVEGVFIVNDFNSGVSTTRYLRVEGVVVAFNKVNLQRNVAGTLNPAEYFEYRPEMVMRLPKAFLRQGSVWSEVAP